MEFKERSLLTTDEIQYAWNTSFSNVPLVCIFTHQIFNYNHSEDDQVKKRGVQTIQSSWYK